MVLTAHVYAEHPDLALTHTIRSLQDGTIGVVSDAGTDPDHDVYHFWVEAPDFDAVEEAFAEDPTVADFSVIVGDDSRRTYRLEYEQGVKLVSPPMTDVGGLTREAESHLNGWLLELQFQDHEGLYELKEYLAEEGINLDVLDLRHTDGTLDRPDFGLTEAQREALMAAFVHGYYDEPRETSLEELAALLDISPTAVSGRLRRGSARLVEEVLIEDER